MTALLTWLATLAPGLTAFFARKAATIAAFTTAFFASIFIYLACIRILRDLVTTSAASLPSTTVMGVSIDWLAMVGQFVPENLLVCVTILVDAYICRLAFVLVNRWIVGTAAAS